MAKKKEASDVKKEEKHHEDTSSKLLQYGSIAFGVGLLIVIIATFLNLSNDSARFVVATLAVLGLVVGFLNVTNKESVSFMVAAITLVIVFGPFLGVMANLIGGAQYLINLHSYVTSLIVPAGVVVALRTIFFTAKDE